MPPPTTRLAVRLEQARAAVGHAGLDALVVFGAANLAYLTGLRMSAGALALTRDRVFLVADGRYADAAAAVEELPRMGRGSAGHRPELRRGDCRPGRPPGLGDGRP